MVSLHSLFPRGENKNGLHTTYEGERERGAERERDDIIERMPPKEKEKKMESTNNLREKERNTVIE